MMRTPGHLAIAITCLFLTGTAAADAPTTLPDAARLAITTNPQIQSAVNEFAAAEEQIRVGKGGYLPRVDLEAAVGQERIEYPRFDADNFTRDRVSLLLNQMIYDGFATRNRVRSYGYEARARYFAVWNASEAISADVARAYLEVLRERELVDLSKENYAAHRLIHEQIQRRVTAGVSRRVDLEQAYGRLALSESNLLTDMTNLHDVSMRYQQLVGETPAPTLAEPEITPGLLPASLDDALRIAYRDNPAMNAAIAGVWSANAAADVIKATMLPRFDIRARQDVWHDKENIDGRYEEGVIELVMTYNLYNGGSDRAERRRLLYKADQASAERDNLCRSIREEVSIATNEMRALEEQLVHLDRHQKSIGRAREAYRRQFNIGQRTLLDMLDTENEYYQSRRAYVIAKRNHAVAYARALASVGALVRALELGNDLHSMSLPEQGDAESPDIAAICPPQPVATPVIDKDAIYQEAINRHGALQSYLLPQSADQEAAPSTAPAADDATPTARPGGW